MAKSENTLAEGETRVGWYFDQRSETPDTVVALQRKRNRPELMVPMMDRPDRISHPLFEFFERDVWTGSGPEGSPRKPPSEVLFRDERGKVTLVGCEGSSGTLSIGGSKTSTGRILADFAVLGAAHQRFAKVNGMRVLSPAVSQWIGLSSTIVERETDGSGPGRVKAVQIRYESQESERVSPILNLEFNPSWITSVDPATGEATGRSYSLVQTRVARPRAWSEHIDLMRAIVDLVNIAGWGDYPIERLEVLRDDSNMRSQHGHSLGDKWLDTVQDDLRVHDEPSIRNAFLFTFRDLGAGAISRWLKLRTRYARALNPLAALPKMTDTYIENQLLQSSIAVDALGYALDDESDSPKRKARGQLPYNDALRNVAACMAWHPLTDVDAWVVQSNKAYMASKHVDRPEVSGREMYFAHVANVMMLRAWLAQQLGVAQDRFNQGVASDPLGRLLHDQ